MSRQYNNPTILLLLEHVPQLSSGSQVHSWGWLIEHDYFRLSNQSNSNRQLSLLTSREILRHDILTLNKVDILKHLINFLGSVSIEVFKTSEDLQMFFGSELREKNVVLRADSENCSEFIHFVEDICVKYLGVSLCWGKQTCQHWESSCFSCSIVTQESKYLVFKHSNFESVNSEFVFEFLYKAIYPQALSFWLLFLELLWQFFEFPCCMLRFPID